MKWYQGLNQIFKVNLKKICECSKQNLLPQANGIIERITKQVSLLNNLNLNNYSFEFTPTETSLGGTLLYIANHLSYKCRNDLNIYKKMNLNLLLLKLLTQKNQIL